LRSETPPRRHLRHDQESNATTGAGGIEDDGNPFEEKMPRLVGELHAQFAEFAKLEAAIRANLKSLNLTP
jgi:hypothetical protein